eukprot:2276618-Lingulodinium_polyedra.AAC.1
MSSKTCLYCETEQEATCASSASRRSAARSASACCSSFSALLRSFCACGKVLLGAFHATTRFCHSPDGAA